MALSTRSIPIILGSILGIMVAILVFVLILFYKKRKESIEFKVPLEKMTRSLRSLSGKSKNTSSGASSSDSLYHRQQQTATPILRDTQFWVPEVYNSIIQPSPTPLRKTSRLQSTLDREIYSKVPDTSYLHAAADDHQQVFDGSTDKKTSSSSLRRNATINKRDLQRRLQSETNGNRGMLNFCVQYKQDKAILVVMVVKAEGLPRRKNDGFCDPFVDLQLNPFYKRKMHSEVHQKTQNPVYNQVFEFEVPPFEVREQTIQFTVLDFNQQLSHEPIGTVLFSLETLDSDAFFAGKEFALWKKIDKMTSESNDQLDGKYLEYPMEMNLDKAAMLLLLSVHFLKIAERLSVTVNKARNLLLMDRKGRLDHPYVTVTLKHFGRVLKKLRTGVVKHETSPVFNKTLVFDVPKHIIDQLSLTVKLRHHNEIGRDRTFAILTIGKNAVGTGAEQWTDMLNSMEMVQRWHRLIPIEPAED